MLGSENKGSDEEEAVEEFDNNNDSGKGSGIENDDHGYGLVSDEENQEMMFARSETVRQLLESLAQENHHHQSSSIDDDDEDDDDDEIIVTEVESDTDNTGNKKKLFTNTASLAALLKGTTVSGEQNGAQRVFSVNPPAGLGTSLHSGKPTAGFTSNTSRSSTNASYADVHLSEELKIKLEKLQQIRIKFLRLLQRLGLTTQETIASQVLQRLTLVAGTQTGQMFSLDAEKKTAFLLEAAMGGGSEDDLKMFSLNVLVLGKVGVGKSATINSIFGEVKTSIGAYGLATTTAVKEIVGIVDGIKIRVFDTPGLKSSALEQGFNTKVLSAVKKLTKKSPPDVFLYVDRLDTQSKNLNDLPLLRTICDVFGPTIWRNSVITLTHAATAPPDGPLGSPLSYDVFVTRSTRDVQQAIGQAVGNERIVNPSSMNPIALVENHPCCRKNRDGHKVLPNGQAWRPLLLLLCYSMKILSEAASLSKTQESFDYNKLFGFRYRTPSLPYLLSWLMQSRTHPKLPADQVVDIGDSEIELADLSDSGQDGDGDEDEYDQLLPFKPLKKSQVAMLSKEQRKAYFEEYDYRVKLLQKKQWKEELRRMKEIKMMKGKIDDSYMEEGDEENETTPDVVPVPLPDMSLPLSFDGDNPVYRYRFLEPTSQLLTRPVLDVHSWDHDCGYDGVTLDHNLAILNQFPAAIAVQITKDKKDFNIQLDSSVAAKHGDNGSSMFGFDIQNTGKSLAYILRGETKFKSFKRNKTCAGLSVTFLGEHVSTGLKVEDQIALGKCLVLTGSTGIVRCQGDSAYGTNVEVRFREADFPIGQDQSSLGLSMVKWRGELALGANLQSQVSIGRSYKMAVRAGLNNKLTGQISVRTSSSDQVQIALLAILPIAKAIYENFWPKACENYPII